MIIKMNQELETIFKDIKGEGLTTAEWSLVESSDMFQTESYVGGFDADEQAFCFSFYPSKEEEYWFQFTLCDLEKALATGNISLRGTLV